MSYHTFEGRVCKEKVEQVLLDLSKANSPQEIFVNSPGGKFEFFQVLGPAIERRGLTTISGRVASSAVILYLLGWSRKAYEDASFYFHEVRAVVDGRSVTVCNLSDAIEYERRASARGREILEEWLRQTRTAQSWFLAFVCERTGLSKSTLLDLMAHEVTLDIRDAVRYGIVHGVLPQSMREQ